MQANKISMVGPLTVSEGDELDSGHPLPDSLLPAPVCSDADSMTALAVLLTQVDEQDRASARQLQSTTNEAAVREEAQRVQAMQQKADDDGGQAIASGLAGIAGGALTALGGGFFPSQQTSASGLNWGKLLEGIGKVSPDIGTLVAGGRKAAADRDDANAAQFEAEAAADLRSYEEAGNEVQSANDSLQKVRDFLDQIQQTENATRLAAAGYRA